MDTKHLPGLHDQSLHGRRSRVWRALTAESVVGMFDGTYGHLRTKNVRASLNFEGTPGERWYVSGNFIDESGADVGGFIRYVYTRESRVHHALLAIDPEHRGRGAGGAFIEENFRQYAAAGIEEVTVTAVDDGRAVWAAKGFDWKNGMPDGIWQHIEHLPDARRDMTPREVYDLRYDALKLAGGWDGVYRVPRERKSADDAIEIIVHFDFSQEEQEVKHGGPGPHEGTGSPQAVHAVGGLTVGDRWITKTFRTHDLAVLFTKRWSPARLRDMRDRENTLDRLRPVFDALANSLEDGDVTALSRNPDLWMRLEEADRDPESAPSRLLINESRRHQPEPVLLFPSWPASTGTPYYPPPDVTLSISTDDDVSLVYGMLQDRPRVVDWTVSDTVINQLWHEALRGREIEATRLAMDDLSSPEAVALTYKPDYQAWQRVKPLVEQAREHGVRYDPDRPVFLAAFRPGGFDTAAMAKTHVMVTIAERLRARGIDPTRLAPLVRGESQKFSSDPMEQVVAGLIQSWARSSNDSNYEMLYVQERAAALFGVDRFAAWHPLTGSLAKDMDELRGKEGIEEAVDAFLLAMHENTQEFFAEQGITHVKAHRGMTKWREDGRLRPLSAWSADRDTAESFAAYQDWEPAFIESDHDVDRWLDESIDGREIPVVLSTTVPVSRVLSCPLTGFGCFMEDEYVLISGDYTDTQMPLKAPRASGPEAKHAGPGPHPGTGSPQTVHRVADFTVGDKWMTDLLGGPGLSDVMAKRWDARRARTLATALREGPEQPSLPGLGGEFGTNEADATMIAQERALIVDAIAEGLEKGTLPRLAPGIWWSLEELDTSRRVTGDPQTRNRNLTMASFNVPPAPDAVAGQAKVGEMFRKRLALLASNDDDISLVYGMLQDRPRILSPDVGNVVVSPSWSDALAGRDGYAENEIEQRRAALVWAVMEPLVEEARNYGKKYDPDSPIHLMAAKPVRYDMGDELVDQPAKTHVMRSIADRLRARDDIDLEPLRLLAASHAQEFSPDPLEQVTASLIQYWANSSNDENVKMLYLQDRAAELFGIREHTPWYEPHIEVELDDLHDTPGLDVAADAFLRAMYEETQEFFRDHGVSHVQVYRGMTSWRTDRTLRPMSAWADDYDMAYGFTSGDEVARISNDQEAINWAERWDRINDTNKWDDFVPPEVVLDAIVPVERILATPFTGFGCYKENEYVILAGNYRDLTKPLSLPPVKREVKSVDDQQFLAANLMLRWTGSPVFHEGVVIERYGPDAVKSMNAFIERAVLDPDAQDVLARLSAERKHLSGLHDQRTHGNRYGPDGIAARLWGKGIDALVRPERRRIPMRWGAPVIGPTAQDSYAIPFPLDPPPLQYDRARVLDALRRPPVLSKIDPRKLIATQDTVGEAGLRYYAGEAYGTSGRTFADHAQIGNKFPVILGNRILSGHHRAAAALAQGRMLDAIVIPEEDE